jgi:hypothetical protein
MSGAAVILVLASRWNEAARSLVARWAAFGAALLTPDDLSEVGWLYRPGRSDEGRAIVGGRPVATNQISGVATLLCTVGEDELVRIVAAERAYVAAEMTAFLVAWLTELPCPVVNRPTPGCLMGPSWSPERWRVASIRAGCRLAKPRAGRGGGITLTVVGETCVGDGDPNLGRATRRLAREAGVECLAVTFTGPEPDAGFVAASLAPDILHPAVADAMLGRLASYKERP